MGVWQGDWIEAQKRCNRMGFELKEMELNGTASGRELEEVSATASPSLPLLVGCNVFVVDFLFQLPLSLL